MQSRAIWGTLLLLGFVSTQWGDAQVLRGKLRERIQERRQGAGSRSGEGADVQLSGPGSCSSPNVAFRIVTFRSGLKAGVWYPTTESASRPWTYANGLSTPAVKDGEIADCGRYPVILFSHGFGGCGTQSPFLTEALAAHGYVVVAPDHEDAKCKVDQPRQRGFERADVPFRQPERWSESTHADRRNDLRRVLDELPNLPELRGRVDTSRVGAAGHSLGGYTVMGMAGAWPGWKDRRIEAVLALSPFAAPFLEHNTVGRIDVPIMLQGGDRDRGITPYLRKPGGVYDAARAPKFYLELRGQGHLDWTVAACRNVKSTAACVDRTPKVSAAVSHAVEFFDRYLGGPAVADDRSEVR
jgi:predicted dienelactone hydrolase